METRSKYYEPVYNFVRRFLLKNGYAPSVREIARNLHTTSTSTVKLQLDRLCQEGRLNSVPGKARSITLPEPAPASPDPQDRPAGQIPILGHVAAGSPIWAESCVEDYVPYNAGPHPEEYFALKVRGESMLNAGILPGDLVVVHCQPEAQNGKIVVARFEDEATVKTLSIQDGQVWLLPENPDYEPIDGTYAQIIGQVVALIRNY